MNSRKCSLLRQYKEAPCASGAGCLLTNVINLYQFISLYADLRPLSSGEPDPVHHKPHKLVGHDAGVDAPGVPGGNAAPGAVSDALAALLVLGYRQDEVMPVLARMEEDLTSEELIRRTLKEMGRRDR